MGQKQLRPETPRPGQIWRFDASSPEDTEVLAQPLEVRYCQFGHGGFRHSVRGVFLDAALVVADRLDTPVHVCGVVLAGSLAFQCFRSTAPVLKSHVPLSMDHLAISMAGEQLDITSQAEGEALSVFVREQRWNELAQELGAEPAAKLGSRLVAVQCPAADIERFARRSKWVLEAATIYPECFQQAGIRRVAEIGLVCSVVELLHSRQQVIENLPAASRRREAVLQVEGFVRDHLSDPLTLLDLCEVAGLRPRALQYAFQEKHGVSPMGYLKLTRLNQAHRLLRNADPRTSNVTVAALQAGFWHLSQFAQDYRAVFGESPKQTLKRPPRD